MVRASMGVVVAMTVSGCCCDLPSLGGGTTQSWAGDVKRAKDNPQTEALEPGTANVFEFQVWEPRDITQTAQDALDEHLARLEVARLELQLAELKKESSRIAELQRAVAQVQAEPAPQLGPLRVVRTVRGVMTFPSTLLADEGGSPLGGCGSCMTEASRNGAVYMYSQGHVSLDLRTVTRAMLKEGVEVHDRFSLGSVGERDPRTFTIPSSGKGVLTLVTSCPAEVVSVTKSVSTGPGSGVIANYGHEDRTWLELRGAPCAKPEGIVEQELIKSTLTPNTTTSETMRRVFELRAKLERGGE